MRVLYEDHTYDQPRQNAITSMGHLFLKLHQNKLDVLLGSSPGKSETVIHQKSKENREDGDCSSIITLRKRNGLPFIQRASVLNATPGLEFSRSKQRNTQAKFCVCSC